MIRSSLQLYNNFTYFLDDPVNGDQFSQLDRRTVYGLNASHAFDVRVAGIETQTRVGLQTRGDDIHVGLFKTLQRETLSTVREDSVREGNVGLWADTTARWTDWLRTTVGIREDYFAGRVLSDTPENSGNAQASMTSPKAGIVLGPWYKTEFYGNAGYGLHSNDIRGATITVDPIDKVTPQDRVPLLVRSKGAELGIRTKAVEGLTSSLAVFVLDFDSELLFVGDAGTTEASRPSRRVGVEWTNQYSRAAVDAFDLDVAYTRARFTDFDPAGDLHPRRAGVDGERRRDVRRRDRLVRRAAGALFRSASADRGRQRSFAGVADLQCARGLQIRQRLAAAARRAQSLQRARPTRSSITICRDCRASRSAASPTGMCIRRSRWRCG